MIQTFECPFCDVDDVRAVTVSNHGLAFRDAFPVCEGHTLVIPRAHVGSVLELPFSSQSDLWALVARVRRDLSASHGVADFTIGVNDGPVAGQAVAHAHIHVIPRRPGEVEDPLWELQEGHCFYCSTRIRGPAHVDHFIPWSRYPVDLGHNFVVAHDRCNSAKAGHLPAPVHLDRWGERNERFGCQLPRIFEETGTPYDLEVSRGVTRWASRQVADRRGLVWERGPILVPLGAGWESLLTAN